MLLMHGQDDGAIDVRLAAISAEVLPSGSRREIIDGAGHFMHLDQPAAVSRLISAHLAG
jgi:pimeloyl-ACP methyl ester carboxylesterase